MEGRFRSRFIISLEKFVAYASFLFSEGRADLATRNRTKYVKRFIISEVKLN
jgi:hypothetical protein